MAQISKSGREEKQLDEKISAFGSIQGEKALDKTREKVPSGVNVKMDELASGSFPLNVALVLCLPNLRGNSDLQ